jgi:hypothetical protein
MTKILQTIADILAEKLNVAKTHEEFQSIYLIALQVDDFAVRRGIYLN